MSEIDIPWPLSNNPGRKPQEGTGRLINVFAEPRGDGSPVWRRAPGALAFAREPSSGSANIDFDANARSATLFSTFFELVASSTTVVDSTSETVTYPTGTQSGDLVFLVHALSDQTTADTWTEPSGFTSLVASVTTSSTPGDQFGYALQYKISTGEGSASVAYPNVTTANGVTLAFTLRGAMSTAPICDTGTVSTGASGDPDAANITATTADSLAIAVGWLDDDQVTTVTAPTSFGHRLFATSTVSFAPSVMVAFQPRPTSGSVTVSSFDSDGDDIWAAYALTVRHD